MKVSRVLPAILVSGVGLASLYAAPALAWKTDQSANSLCEDGQALIDWTFTNKESNKKMIVTVKVNETGKVLAPKQADAGATIGGTIDAEAEKLTAGTLTFELKWADGTKGVDSRQASYSAIECEQPKVISDTDEEPKTTPPAETLPNTGPAAFIGLYGAITAASGAAWLVTKKELANTLRNR
ncbi:MAG TPA: hypothetical protein VGA08_00200 [Candidatus Saccharimonadales bacterium]